MRRQVADTHLTLLFDLASSLSFLPLSSLALLPPSFAGLLSTCTSLALASQSPVGLLGYALLPLLHEPLDTPDSDLILPLLECPGSLDGALVRICLLPVPCPLETSPSPHALFFEGFK